MDWKNCILYPFIGRVLKAGLWLFSCSRLPQSRGKVVLKGLQEQVEVLRDRWGVPHIYARNMPDIFFGQGFVHAQERLWQMDFTRRVVFGRLAEVLGEAAVPVDRAMRTVSLFRTAEKEAFEQTGEFGPLLEAYCAGVNAWIERACATHKLPVEFALLGYTPEPWRPADSLAWAKMMSWTLAANWQSELYRRLLLDQLGAQKVHDLEIDLEHTWSIVLDLGLAMAQEEGADPVRRFAGPRIGEGVGSNNWVLHGSRTASGKPLLANDPHLEMTTPAIWFELHLVAEDLDVAGVSLPGVPLVIAGHNRQLAWGLTDSCPDVQDLYEEHLRRTANGDWEYEYRGEWLPAQVRREQIRVKGGKTVEEEVVVTRHGPVVNILFREAFPDVPPMALRWTALEPDHNLRAFFAMNRARNCGEFHQALRDFANPSQNLVFADVHGDIQYTMNGRVPIRARGDGTVPAPGWSGDYEWLGYIPLDELPHIENPPRGFLATANNQIQRPDFPHFLGQDYLVADRIGRIVELIEAREKHDLEYVKAMHYDRVSLSARRVARELGGLTVSDPTLQEIIRRMRAWDGKLESDEPLASVYEATIRLAAGMMIEHHIGELGGRARGLGPFAGAWPDHLWEWFVRQLDCPDSPWFDLGHGENCNQVLALALQQAVDFLVREIGPDLHRWKWGRLHTLTFGHVLGGQKPLDRVFNLGPFPIGGDGTTIWASFSSFSDLERRPVVGPPFRFIADLGDLDHCWGQLVPGQSGHLASRHFKDGLRPWFSGRYHPMLYKRDDVEANLETRLILMSE